VRTVLRKTPTSLFCAMLLFGLAGGNMVCAGALPGFSRNRVAVEGAELSYLKRPGPGPVLVLIPGSFVGAEDFTGVVDGLSADLSILIVELRGHGESWPPPSHGTIERFAGDVLAAVDHAGVRRFYVGGHSIGGMIAVEIAGRRPVSVLGAIPIEGWTHHLVAKEAFGGQNDSTLSATHRERIAKLREPVMTRWTQEQRTEFAAIWRQWSGLEILRRTPVPVLEIWGDRGRSRPSMEQMQIPDRPNIELYWVAGASHYLPLERPDEVAGAINRFVERVGRISPGRQ